ncbi:hypothetical protein HBZS_108060 [Helicobacter bizzozeronii CCUG 35545]|nr:hypothetical protein HBZS_108060 [Helicobacter bizzozeronii CCUG 35545]
MFEKLELIIKNIENSKEEIEVLLKIANISLGDFIFDETGELRHP